MTSATLPRVSVVGLGKLGAPLAAVLAAIPVLLYAGGLMRPEEKAGLANLADVDRAAGTVRVLGKGRKERMVPFGGAAAEVLDDGAQGHRLRRPSHRLYVQSGTGP